MGWMDQPAVDGDLGLSEAKAGAPVSKIQSQPAVPGAAPVERQAGWGDTLIDTAKSAGSGIVRGATALADLPGDIMSGGMKLAERATGYDIPEYAERAMMAVSPMTAGRALTGESLTQGMEKEIPSVMGYQPKTTPGRYSRTVGEFVPGAAATALTGGTSLVPLAFRTAAQSIIPGVVSEFAGTKAKEMYPSSPWAEPAARLAGSLLGGFGANRLEGGIRSMISPGGGADPARLAMANELRKRGIPITAGQATRSPSVINAEADTAAAQAIAGAAPDSEQARAFTSATMRFLGSADDLATPEAMQSAKASIVGQMKQSLNGVDVPPSLPLSNKVADAATYYAERTPDAQKIPLIRGIIDRINQGNVIPGDQLATWRSSLGDLLYHPNDGVRGTAFMLRDAIDDAIENSMKAMGQPERIAAWREARNQYRNYLAVQDALKVTKEAGLNGIVTPKDLMAALAKQDKSGIVTGGRGEIGDFARSAATVMKPLPASAKHGLIDTAVRRVGPIAAAGGSGFGAMQLAQMGGFGPLATGAVTGLAMAKPLYEGVKDAIRSNAMRPIIQRYLENQLVNPSTGVSGMGAAARAGAAGYPSYDERIGRKAGGRVGVDHDRMADRLVGAAERAKKGISKGTEQLLEMPDDHIAHALELANRSI